MNCLDSLCLVFSDIDRLTSTANKKNLANCEEELSNILSVWGLEAEKYLLRSLFAATDFAQDSRGAPKDTAQADLLRKFFNDRVQRPGFLSNFAYAYFHPLRHKRFSATQSPTGSAAPIPSVTKTLRLTKAQEVIYCLALSHLCKIQNICESFDISPDFDRFLLEYLKQRVPELLQGYVDPEKSSETGLQESGVESLHSILSHLVDDPSKFGVSESLWERFIGVLKKDFPILQAPVVLSPLLYPLPLNELFTDTASGVAGASGMASDNWVTELNDRKKAVMSDTSMVKPIIGSLGLMIQEIGYGLCANVQVCQEQLNRLEGVELTPSSIAHVLSMMVRTHTGLKESAPLAQSGSPWPDKSDLDETWNVEVFVRVVKQMVPMLNWSEVVSDLDQPGFEVRDKKGLALLTTALSIGLADHIFPVALLYRQWNNKEGQHSWIKQILNYPDVFCLADLPHRNVQIEMLKAPPDETDKNIATWRSLDLLECLLQLAGSPGLGQVVKECFFYPMRNCPDLLTLGILQVNMDMTSLRVELLTTAVPIFLGNHQNALIVLQYAWNLQTPNERLGIHVKNTIMHSMAEWYIRNLDDQTKLGKIFEVAHEIKALQHLLNLGQFKFTIDLACLASRRDFLKLDKWLADKVQEFNEKFVHACAEFVKRRSANIVGAPAEAQDPNRGIPPLSTENLTCLLMFLQSQLNNVSPTLTQHIMQILNNCRINLSKSATGGPIAPSNAARPPQSLAGGGPSAPGSLINPIGPSSGGAPGQQSGGAGTGSSSGFGGGGTTIYGMGANSGNFGNIGSSLASQHQQQQPQSGLSSQQPTSSSAPGYPMPPPPAAVIASQQQQVVTSSPNRLNPRMDSMMMSAASENLGFQSQLAARQPTGGGFTSSTLGSLRPSMPSTAGVGAPGGGSHQPTGGAGSGMPGAGGDRSVLSNFPDISQSFNDEIQDEANTYFQQIYTAPPQTTMSIEEFLSTLKNFKDSFSVKHKNVFACMLKNLFEEYKFFPFYPERELEITARVFGGIIRENLVEGMPFAFALRAVFEALKKTDRTSEHDQKMRIFGFVALDQFKTRLREYPKYCETIMKEQFFVMPDFPKTIAEYLRYGAMKQNPPPEVLRSQTPVVFPGDRHVGATPGPALLQQQQSNPGQASLPASLHSSAASAPSLQIVSSAMQKLNAQTVANAVTTAGAGSKPSITQADIGTLVSATENEESQVVNPPEVLVEKVAFMFNNLSKANLIQKIEEIHELLNDRMYHPWLAQYLVMKRVSIEVNFHPLYSSFMTAVNDKHFYNLVLRETYRNIKILLRSDKAATNFSDRTLLKNLGHWLGMITIGFNKPILQNDLDVKSLLLEAFYLGQKELLFVIPFVAKIVESAELSRIFRPPNPWTMGLLHLMREMHHESDLRLNLKFEIEVLCKKLNIELSNLKPPNLLKIAHKNINQQLSNPAKLEKPTQPLQMGPSPLTTSGDTGRGSVPASATGAPTPLPEPKYAYHDINTTNLTGLSQHIQINASLPLFRLNPPLKTLVPRGIERAVADLLTPIADRALRAAMTVTEHIVKKDFALDHDEGRMRLAAQQMVRSLTAGIAMLSSREAISLMMRNQLQTLFQAQTRGAAQEQQQMIEETCKQVADDNMELVQAFIVKSAVERAVPEIDRRLQQDFELRRGARAENRRHFDPNAMQYQVERMPERVRVKAGDVSSQQMSVYEQFVHIMPGFRHAPEHEMDTMYSLMRQSGATSVAKLGDMSQLMGGGVTGFAGSAGGSATAVGKSAPPTSQGMVTAMAAQGVANLPVPDEPEPHITYKPILSELERFLLGVTPREQFGPQFESITQLRNSLQQVCSNPREHGAALLLIQHCVDTILAKFRRITVTDGSERLEALWMEKMREAHVAVLKSIIAAVNLVWVQKQVTRFVIDTKTDAFYNVDAIDVLIRGQLMYMPHYDLQLAQLMGDGISFKTYKLAVDLLTLYFTDENQSQILKETDFTNTIDMISRLTSSSTSQAQVSDPRSSQLSQVMDYLRNPNNAINAMAPAQASQPGAAGGAQAGFPDLRASQNFAGSAQAAATAGQLSLSSTQRDLRGNNVKDFQMSDDPPQLAEKTEFILREWVNMYNQAHNFPHKSSTDFFRFIVQEMHRHGILASDDLITRFFRLCTEMCVDLVYRMQSAPNQASMRPQSFHTLDAYVRLISLLVRHSGESNLNTKHNLLSKVLGIIAGVLLMDHEVRKVEFHQLPYHRILLMLFLDISQQDAFLEPIQLQILFSITNTLVCLQPSKAPGFTFAWLDIIGNRQFMMRMLCNPNAQNISKTWGMYATLIIQHLKFLGPFLRNVEMSKAMLLVYKGTLRILLVLLHDFPELLSDYHFAMCEAIPPNCVQLRNLILSAYPRNMRLPDPFMPNLKVDQLPEINMVPRICGLDIAKIIQPPAFKDALDCYLENRTTVDFLHELKLKLKVSNEPGQKYNENLMSAVVLYVGIRAIETLHKNDLRPSMNTVPSSSSMDLFQDLAICLDNEGRYLLFNAIANQLRYPNSHTHYFSCAMLYLFAESPSETIQEQITRILFERLVAMRPHPWGLLITFIELIKNKTYRFWTHDFVRCAPEIERLFETVARSCVARQNPQES